MKGGPSLKKIFFSSFFLAAVPAVLVVLFLPPFGTKSRLVAEPVDKASSKNIYEDLNSDSISEVIKTGKGSPYYFILVQDNDMRVYDQWNLPDSMDTAMSDIFFGNCNHDRFKEIYIFTYRDDSLFLNINEFFSPTGIKAEHIFITRIRVIKGKITSTIWPAGFYDANGDGTDELFFSIQTGFGVEPRRLYSYDIAARKLRSSRLIGVISQFPQMVDADGDGRPEIFGLVGASGNSKTWYPYSDWSTWLMIFNDSLEFKFPPVEFPGLTNRMETEAYSTENFRGYLASIITGSADSLVPRSRIMLFSLDGSRIRERSFTDLKLNPFASMAVLKNRNIQRIYMMGRIILELNDKLEIVRKISSPFNTEYRCFKEDLNFDGEDELVLFSAEEEKIVVFNGDLNKIGEAKIKGAEEFFRFSRYSSRDHGKRIFLAAGQGHGYFLKLSSNRYYYMGYLAYPGIYFLIFLFIVLIKRINTLQVVQKESLNRRLITLQLQGIKSQLDPHFTFNTLNSVASLIYLEDRQAAYDYMNKFTMLLRGMLNDAERIYRTLGEEIEFVTTYLDLEKLRLGDKFNYSISIGPGVNLLEQVPKLALHTFAENSVKHGIMPLHTGGMIRIYASQDKNVIRLEIEDNGIGRTKSQGQTSSTGKGLKLTREFYDILNQINKRSIRLVITDLFSDSGEPSGTRADIWIPLNQTQDRI